MVIFVSTLLIIQEAEAYSKCGLTKEVKARAWIQGCKSWYFYEGGSAHELLWQIQRRRVRAILGSNILWLWDMWRIPRVTRFCLSFSGLSAIGGSGPLIYKQLIAWHIAKGIASDVLLAFAWDCKNITFLAVKFICQLWLHWSRVSRSCCRIWWSEGSWIGRNKMQSSVNNLISDQMLWVISLMYRVWQNKVAP